MRIWPGWTRGEDADVTEEYERPSLHSHAGVGGFDQSVLTLSAS